MRRRSTCQGKPAEAVPLLKEVAEGKAKRADRNAKDAAAAYRNLASIAAVADHKSARGYYAEAARLDPTDIEGLFWNGWFQAEAGDLKAAEAAFTRVIDLARVGANDQMAYWARLGLGDIQKDRGSLGAALATYRDAEAFGARLSAADPGNAGWRRDLSVSYDKIGGVQEAQGDLAGALKSYRDSLAIRERLSAADPGNVEWRRDLSVSYARLADVYRKTRNKKMALDAMKQGRAIALTLTKLSPDNADWKNDLAWFDGQIASLGK